MTTEDEEPIHVLHVEDEPAFAEIARAYDWKVDVGESETGGVRIEFETGQAYG